MVNKNCDFSGFSLQDILMLLGAQARSGELEIESGNNIGSIYLYQGRILQANSPYSRAIGDLLVEEGVITEAELLEALKLQKMDAHAPLGSLFLKSGKVSFEIIEMMVHEQIRQSIKEFNSWVNLKFRFVEGDVKPYDQIHLVVHEFIHPAILETAMKFLAGPRRTAITMAPAERSENKIETGVKS